MRICGIKLTHDGAIALVDDARLVFCIEQEKRYNNPRYQPIDNLEAVAAALAEHGLRAQDVDQFVIDGWSGEVEPQFRVLSGGHPSFSMERHILNDMRRACSLRATGLAWRSRTGFFLTKAILTSQAIWPPHTAPVRLPERDNQRSVWCGTAACLHAFTMWSLAARGSSKSCSR